MLPRPKYRARLREEANLDVIWTLVQDMKFDIFGVCLRHERNKNRRNKKNSPNNVFHQWLLTDGRFVLATSLLAPGRQYP
jgi:hypothetical protein